VLRLVCCSHELLSLLQVHDYKSWLEPYLPANIHGYNDPLAFHGWLEGGHPVWRYKDRTTGEVWFGENGEPNGTPLVFLTRVPRGTPRLLDPKFYPTAKQLNCVEAAQRIMDLGRVGERGWLKEYCETGVFPGLSIGDFKRGQLGRPGSITVGNKCVNLAVLGEIPAEMFGPCATFAEAKQLPLAARRPSIADPAVLQPQSIVTNAPLMANTRTHDCGVRHVVSLACFSCCGRRD